MHMSSYIADHISAEEGNSAKRLEQMEEKINRFLFKNVNASVSHVGHHNYFYSYVEDALKIKEDIVALDEGVEVLEEILRRRDSKKEQDKTDRMQSAFAILTIVSITSLFADWVEMFDNYTAQGFIWKDGYTVILTVVCVIALIVIVNARHSLMKLFHIDSLLNAIKGEKESEK